MKMTLWDKQKVFALGLFAVTSFIVYSQEQDEVHKNSEMAVVETQPKVAVIIPAKGAPVDKANVVSAQDDTCNNKSTDCNKKQTTDAVAPVESAAAVKKNSAWHMGEAKSAIPSIVLNEKIVASEVVEINQHPESFPQVGEQIVLPMLNGQQVVADVQSISSSPNGDKSWSGHLQGQGTDYPVIMTYGEHSVFAMITTPQGSYSMESVNGVGWLYKNPSEFELSAAGNKDYLDVVDMH